MAALLILLLGLATYYFLSTKKTSYAVQPKTIPDASHADSTQKSIFDSSNKLPAATTTDTPTFNIVINEYSSQAAAQNAFDKLTTYKNKLVIISLDSPVYKIAMPFKTPLSDTTRARDSLRSIFGDNLYVQLKK